MKKFLTLSLFLGSMAFAVPAANAAAPASQPAAQQRNQRVTTVRKNRRGVRVVTRTHIVRQGFRTYRETIQTKYFPNGRSQTKVISRVRVR